MSDLRNLWKPVRNSNVAKVLIALVLGVVLVTTLMPSSNASATGAGVKITRSHGQFIVEGWRFPANTTGSTYAQVGTASHQKSVRTDGNGYFYTVFKTLTADHTGSAVAKAWVGNGYANVTAYLTSGDGGSDFTWNYGQTSTAAPTTTSTTAAPVVGSSGGTASPAKAPVTTPTTVKPTTTTTVKPAPTTTTTAKPAAVTASSVGSGSGFSDSPSGNWKLAFSDDFNGSSIDKSKWGTYDGSGNAGIGTRSSAQDKVSNGEMTITGNGWVGGGMASQWSGTYGLYEIRAKMDKNSTGYNDALMLWPSSEHWPVDGEVDLSEIFDGATNQSGSFAHWGSNNTQTGRTTNGDFSQWHTYAVDWEPGSVTYYIDGNVVMTVNGAGAPNTAHFIAMQLDVSSNGNKDSGAQLHVDWVKAYQH